MRNPFAKPKLVPVLPIPSIANEHPFGTKLRYHISHNNYRAVYIGNVQEVYGKHPEFRMWHVIMTMPGFDEYTKVHKVYAAHWVIDDA